jgi:group I intron endonuclease
MINNKRYVGITKTKPNVRWKNKGRGYIENKHFWNSIQKYGWDNFDHSIIASNLTHDEAKNFEIKLIKLLDTQNRSKGYNRTKGGDGGGYEMSVESRKKMSDAKKGVFDGENNPMYGISPSERMSHDKYQEWLYKHIHAKELGIKFNSSKIICLTTNEIFESISDASKKYNIQDGDISSCCLKKLCSAGRHPLSNEKMVWQYYEDYFNGLVPLENTHEKQIICCNNKEIFNTIIEASKKYNISPSSILLCCQRKYKYAGEDLLTGEKLIWQYLTDYEAGIVPQKVRKVRCINTNEIFNTTSEAALKYNIKFKSNIRNCCNGIAKSAGKLFDTNEKLVWEYVY